MKHTTGHFTCTTAAVRYRVQRRLTDSVESIQLEWLSLVEMKLKVGGVRIMSASTVTLQDVQCQVRQFNTTAVLLLDTNAKLTRFPSSRTDLSPIGF